MSVIICCSSGAKDRYKKDILRAMAMPNDTILQFRYEERHVLESLYTKISSSPDKVSGTRCLICFCDQSNIDKSISLIPCRWASVSETEAVGTTISIKLKLHEFANVKTDELERFLDYISGSTTKMMPHRVLPDPKVKGHHMFEITDNAALEQRISTSNDYKVWQKTITQLCECPDFSNETCMYSIKGINKLSNWNTSITNINSKNKKSLISPINGHFILEPNQSYQINFFYYLPESINPNGVRITVNNSPSISFTTNNTFSIDSNYDTQDVNFLTVKPQNDISTVLSITRQDPNSDKQINEFDLNLNIKQSKLSVLFIGMFAGVLLASPKILEVWGKSAETHNANTSASSVSFVNNPILMTILYLSFSIGATVWAAFRFPKSI